ncbi:AEC family transporter [Candidatus Pelagibacter communis]|jgi:predicted permease|uniref:AEC family transporter n=1 Tax=Pelagibacter ubique TaxID=198252 RepID=UPI00094D7137|nr:AEC family transporter [Candidatus Pelagibacter ubique]|tara:strand:+ start:204 stop:1106 length:903 start_codon:yes stop_codon:yes gene_type:complete
MEIYIKLFEVVFPVFFVVGIGYYLGKKNPKIDTKFITNFAANIGTPAMVIYAVTSTGINFEIFRDYFWYYLLAIICFSIVGIINLFLINTKDIIRELPPLIFPNTGNMGLPICLFAYGSQGLGVSASITSLIILMHFTVGVFLADRKFNLDVIIKNPPFYAIIFSAIVLFYEIDMPVFVINTTEWLMYATIFLILMSLGIALTRLKVFSLNNAVISSITRMFIGPLIGIGLIWFFDLEGFAAGVLLIQCSMPSAVLNYLVGSIYSPKKVVDSVASTIVVSTLMSFITIPIVVYFALRYFS